MNQSDIKALNELKMLSIDMINNAKGGHPGTVLSMAPVMYTLFTRVLRVDSKNNNYSIVIELFFLLVDLHL